MNTRRFALSVMALLLIAAALACAYYYFYGRTYVYRFSEAQLQQALSERLPSTRTYLLIFQVTLDHPRVTLAGGSDRVQAGLDITLNVRVGDQPLPLAGSVDASGGVRYEPTTGQLFLTRPQIEHLELQGVPQQYTAPAAAALSRALETYYADHAIYTLSASHSRELAARLVLKSVSIENRQLVVTLGIGGT